MVLLVFLAGGILLTGQPLLANAQSAAFAPLHLLALPLPPLSGLTVAAAWQVLLALLLMHVLLIALGAGGRTRSSPPSPTPFPPTRSFGPITPSA